MFLAYVANTAAVTSLRAADIGSGAYRPSANPFTLGVASGDPSADGMVLWTRLATSPLEPGGGLPPTPVDVVWELADDDHMKRVVSQGKTTAMPQLGHSVHVTAEGLQPDRWYWYRFRAGDFQSPIGRTRTAPRADQQTDRMSLAFVSCQRYEHGFYAGYRDMAEAEIDLVIHLGDYIYEKPAPRVPWVRQPIRGEAKTLDDYRRLYSLYRTDSDLQAMHARCPWLVTWDDHEFDNNYAGVFAENPDTDPTEFLIRRAAAYQAYFEMMPLRRRALPRGPLSKLYQGVNFGRLASFYALDTRQYRTDQPHGDGPGPLDAESFDSANTILGHEQRRWLQRSLLESQATWNVMAQQVMMGLVTAWEKDGVPMYGMDKWAGYAAERRDLVCFLADRRIPNPIVLTGDIHSNWVNELREDDRQTEQPIVATEFVGTSISSGGNGFEKLKNHDEIMARNPCVKFHNRERGYVHCVVTPNDWRADYVVIQDVQKADSPTSIRASFRVEAGRTGVEPA